jgi:hypothetical protein
LGRGPPGQLEVEKRLIKSQSETKPNAGVAQLNNQYRDNFIIESLFLVY